MGVWSPAFQHRFLDGNLLNFNAAPGSAPDISFEAPVVRPTPPADERGFPVRRGNRFDYQFEPGVFGSVVSADIKLDIDFPPGIAGAAQTLLPYDRLHFDRAPVGTFCHFCRSFCDRRRCRDYHVPVVTKRCSGVWARESTGGVRVP